MNIRKASENDADKIYQIISSAINRCYPQYYPDFAVEFFLYWHSKSKISERILNEDVYVMQKREEIIATGYLDKNYLGGLYVAPDFQHKGYGKAFLDFLENKISESYCKVTLASSLPACIMYEKRGYKTVKHEVEVLEKGYLVYEIMEKNFAQSNS